MIATVFLLAALAFQNQGAMFGQGRTLTMATLVNVEINVEIMNVPDQDPHVWLYWVRDMLGSDLDYFNLRKRGWYLGERTRYQFIRSNVYSSRPTYIRRYSTKAYRRQARAFLAWAHVSL